MAGVDTSTTKTFPSHRCCAPPSLRPAVMAIYRFARTADDLADEGDAAAAQRCAQLADLPRRPERVLRRRTARQRPLAGGVPLAGRAASASTRCRRSGCTPCSMPSSRTCATRAMPTVRRCWTTARARPTRSGACCCTCTASAMRCRCASPTPSAAPLQLINFWQDLSVDLPRDRVYVPLADLQRSRAGAARAAATPGRHAAPRALVRDLVQWAARADGRGRTAGIAPARPRRLGIAPGGAGRPADS